jgi:hypothetical protein
MWLFQNECDSNSEADPEITCSGGSGTETVIATVLRIPGRNTAANFVLGTVSANGATNNNIAFGQNSPSIDDGNAILAIGVKSRAYQSGGTPDPISGITAGLDWTKLVNFKSTSGNNSTLSIDYAHNDSGSAYTTGTSGTMAGSWTVAKPSAGVYLEVPLL